eukprot:1161282-Pelagomonas_calceolata.AAC.10
MPCRTPGVLCNSNTLLGTVLPLHLVMFSHLCVCVRHRCPQPPPPGRGASPVINGMQMPGALQRLYFRIRWQCTLLLVLRAEWTGHRPSCAAALEHKDLHLQLPSIYCPQPLLVLTADAWTGLGSRCAAAPNHCLRSGLMRGPGSDLDVQLPSIMGRGGGVAADDGNVKLEGGGQKRGRDEMDGDMDLGTLLNYKSAAK